MPIELIVVLVALALLLALAYFLFIRPAMNKTVDKEAYVPTDAQNCERVHGDLWEPRGTYPETTSTNSPEGILVVVNRPVFYCPACEEHRTPTIYNGRHVDEL